MGESIKTLVKGIIGFVILDLYFNLFAVRLGNAFLQFTAILIFFPIAFIVTKWTGLNGLKGIGLFFHKGWQKNFLSSFSIGFGFWMLWYGIEFVDGHFQFVGTRNPLEAVLPLAEVLVGFFVGSLVNDLIVRGYVMNLLKGKLHTSWIFMVSLLIYAFDDCWNAGFSISNTIFSLILGFSLTFAFYITGSIWADTGIHFGLNVAYGLFFGLVGNPATAFFIVKETNRAAVLSILLSYTIPALMFFFALWALKFYAKTNNMNHLSVTVKRGARFDHLA